MGQARIVVIGTGYVGLTTGACLASLGHRVTCVDVDETKVARLAAAGLTTDQIAERLVISRHTAATHLQHIYARLGVKSRVGLARALTDAGLE